MAFFYGILSVMGWLWLLAVAGFFERYIVRSREDQKNHEDQH